MTAANWYYEICVAVNPPDWWDSGWLEPPPLPEPPEPPPAPEPPPVIIWND
jgi:hypothetical protein